MHADFGVTLRWCGWLRDAQKVTLGAVNYFCITRKNELLVWLDSAREIFHAAAADVGMDASAVRCNSQRR